ncbi:SGNH hydrolase-type esterase domain-containing protein [Cynara cardunculus var. scolymus]|uniref:SGNH hydrolase-type esterase domain-containing protein n=1 Tax=Cynara cardunculus var. scolymus TaxID=59895 RepID=A0A103XEZ7_CYNCS|nr:SGNH hydrolase-type esterase domain-containing protein [Cynara cardunculus var. scolymus]
MIMKLTVIVLWAVLVVHSQATDIPKLRLFAAKNNVSCIYVFGDSSVDPGNNNNLETDQKVNFLPYGKDFYHGQPTGRFSNGRLPTDLIADALGHTKAIPAYLDPNLTSEQLLHGAMHAEGARRLAVVGMEPFVCIPLIKALGGTTHQCDEVYNKVALTFNSKVKALMATLQPSLGTKSFYTDIYGLVLRRYRRVVVIGIGVWAKL